jgi:predicted nuclease of predicted toxin-antitoxin system
MKLLADESVDRPIIARLRSDGHDIASIAEDSPGIADDEVLSRACREGVVPISADKGFGELVYRRAQPHAGVLLLRIPDLNESEKCDLVSRTVGDRGGELPGAFSVLTGELLRIRRVPSGS